jgi:fumarate reductase subunit C
MMDGRWFTLVFLLILPAALIGVTVWRFAANPLVIFILLVAMVAGGFYLLSYTSSFGGPESAP